MIQTLMTRTLPPFTQFRLLIFDEAHHAPAPVFGSTLQSLNCPLTLGLTATPTRKDGLHRLIHHSLGPMAYQKVMESQCGVRVNVCTYTCDAYLRAPPSNRVGSIDYATMVTKISEDRDRTGAIVDAILKLLEDPARHVLVLSHRRAHCEDIVSRMRARGFGDVALYIGGMKNAVATAKVLVATYSLVSEGFDVPRLNTLVLATPASDVQQTVGRILRGVQVTQPLILDVVDQWSVCFAQAAKRRKTYAGSGFTVSQGGMLTGSRMLFQDD